MGWLKRRLPTRRWKRVCIYLLSVFVMLVAGDMVLVQCWRRVEISRETTYITSPLKADGMPDYIAARNAAASGGVTRENNAAPALLEICGTAQAPATWREEVLPQLGMATMGTPAMVLPYGAWLKDHSPATLPATAADGYRPSAADVEEQAAYKQPWKTSEHPDRAAWLAGQRETLAMLREALTKDRLYIPWNSRSLRSEEGAAVDVLLPYLGKMLPCERLLQADAMRAAGAGDRDAFLEDETDALRLARLMAQESTVIGYLVSVAMESDAWQGIAQGAATPGFLDAAAAESAVAIFRGITPFPSESKMLREGERFYALDSLCYASRHGFAHTLLAVSPGPAERMQELLAPVDYNSILRKINRAYDQLANAHELPTYAQRKQRMESIDSESRGNAHLWSIGDTLVAILTPSFTSSPRYVQTAYTDRDIAIVSLALRVFHLKHAEFPTAIAALAPEDLPAVPLDGFIGEALHYRREKKGYLLYSVGPNGLDDGGTERKDSKNGNYDLVVRAKE